MSPSSAAMSIGDNSTQENRLGSFDQIRLARDIIASEAAALTELSKNLPADLTSAAEMLVDCEGAVIVVGIGKAGWIGRKISASLASTGTASHFVHPSEAMHGDFGRIQKNDVVIALSNSGETSEMLQILPTLKSLGVRIISITSTAHNSLARYSDLVLDYGKHVEACPLRLAPTTTTTVMLALGDALAMVAAQISQLQPHDFARCHPGGSLGRKLSNAKELMRPASECRIAQDHKTIREIYIELSGPKRRSGALILTNERGQLTGVFTDSDLARILENQHDHLLDQPICELMSSQPAFVSGGEKALVAVEILASLNISELPVVDANYCPIGLIDVTDVVGLFPCPTDSQAA